LLMLFAEHRVEEAVELILEGRFEDLDKAVDGYQKHTELLTQTMAHVEAQDPDEAIKLRLELQEKLQEQARLMEAFIEDGGEADHLHVQIQKMLETNTKLSLRINENEEAPETEIEGLDETEVASSAASDAGNMGSEETSGQNGSGRPSFEVNSEEEGTLKFGLSGKGENGVYAEIDGLRFDCTIEGDTAACNINGGPQKGNINLYDKQTNQFLFSCAYDYEYVWGGGKNDHGKNEEPIEGGDSENEINKNSKDN